MKDLVFVLAVLGIAPVFSFGCSVVIDPLECDDNAQCVLEDGTQLVCAADNMCVDAPELGDDCESPDECLDPLVCVSTTQSGASGVCAQSCTDSVCDDPDLPQDWTCCQLSDGTAACLAPTACPSS